MSGQSMNHGSKRVSSNDLMITYCWPHSVNTITFVFIPKPYSMENTLFFCRLYPKSLWPNDFLCGQSARFIWEYLHEECPLGSKQPQRAPWLIEAFRLWPSPSNHIIISKKAPCQHHLCLKIHISHPQVYMQPSFTIFLSIKHQWILAVHPKPRQKHRGARFPHRPALGGFSTQES